MKILHTSDWHLGAHLALLGESARTARECRWQAVERLVELAGEQRVDLVLVAGDTFDSVDVEDDTVARCIQLLERFAPARVMLLPGNHDPVIAGGIWDRPIWNDLGEHVVLATSESEIELPPASEGAPAAVVLPCPIRQRHSRRDPTDVIPERSEDDVRMRIGLAHGSLDTLGKADNFPISAERAKRCGLDYLALGDWHTQRVFAGGTVAYSGTPESMSFSEPSAGRALLVQLDPERRAAPSLEPVEIGSCRWLQVERTVRDATDLAELEADLLSLAMPKLAAVRMKLDVVVEAEPSLAAENQRQQSLLGRLTEDDYDAPDVSLTERLATLESRWRRRLMFLDWRLEQLSIPSTDLPQGLRFLDETLQRAMSGEQLGAEFAELNQVDSAVLREACWTLRMLAAEESH